MFSTFEIYIKHEFHWNSPVRLCALKQKQTMLSVILTLGHASVCLFKRRMQRRLVRIKHKNLNIRRMEMTFCEKKTFNIIILLYNKQIDQIMMACCWIFLAAVDPFLLHSLAFLIVVPLWLFVLLMDGDRKWVLKNIHVSEAEYIRKDHTLGISRQKREMCLTCVSYTNLNWRMGSGYS